jgi:hypothetical protein
MHATYCMSLIDCHHFSLGALSASIGVVLFSSSALRLKSNPWARLAGPGLSFSTRIDLFAHETSLVTAARSLVWRLKIVVRRTSACPLFGTN